MSVQDRAPMVAPRARTETVPAPARQATAQWRFDLRTGEWWWSQATYRIHGFEPHEIVPTTALVLAHNHPQDRDEVRLTLERAAQTGDPFHSLHRILDAEGDERVVFMTGQGRRDRDTDEVVELMGYLVDITAPVAERAEMTAGEHIRASAAHRGAIEQAKGILSVTHGLTVEEAFTLLRQVSNQHNVPVRTLADRLVNLGRILPVDAHRRHCVDEYLRNPI